MAKMFRITYDIVTHESAEQGDFAENGFVDNIGFKYPIETVNKNDNLKQRDRFNMYLRDVSRIFYADYFNGRYFEESPHQNYKTGEYTTFALHIPDNTTESSIKRLCRFFKIKD